MTSLDDNQGSDNLGSDEETFYSFSDDKKSARPVDSLSSRLCLLLRVKGDDNQPLPMNIDLEQFVVKKIEESMGIHPISVNRVNVFDVIVELGDETTIFEVAQVLQKVQVWEERSVLVNSLIGTYSYIGEICRQRNIISEQQAELQEKAKQFQKKLQERDCEIEQRKRWCKEELAKHDESRDDCIQRWKASLTELVQQPEQQATTKNRTRHELHPSYLRTSDTDGPEVAHHGIQFGDHFFFSAEADHFARTENSSIQKQLNQIATLLQEVKFKNKNKTHKGSKTLKKERSNSVEKNSEKGKELQCYRCLGWGHMARSCSNKEPVKGSREWEKACRNSTSVEKEM